MESYQGKLFISGISWDTDENLLRKYFSNYGEILEKILTQIMEQMKNPLMEKKSCLMMVSDDTNRKLEVHRETRSALKTNLKNEDQPETSLFSSESFSAILKSSARDDTFDELLPEGSQLVPFSEDASASSFEGLDFLVGHDSDTDTEVIPKLAKFVFDKANEEGLKDAFADQPGVLGAKVIYERNTGRSRGFGFISFEAAENVQSALDAMNGVEVQGRALRLNLASERATVSRPSVEEGETEEKSLESSEVLSNVST